MSTDASANKDLVRDYFRRVSAGDPDVHEMLSPDITWWVPQSSPLGGTHEGKEAVLALMGSGVDLYDADTPMEIEIEQLVAEGDTVCAQLVISATTASGEPYRNHYHFVFRIRDGGIVAVKEYVDTLYVQEKLFDAREAAS